MDKLIKLFSQHFRKQEIRRFPDSPWEHVVPDNSLLLDIISDETQSIDIILAALISLLDCRVGDVGNDEFVQVIGLGLDTLLTQISLIMTSSLHDYIPDRRARKFDDQEDIYMFEIRTKHRLYRSILRYAAENLNAIYSETPQYIQHDLRPFSDAYADAVKPNPNLDEFLEFLGLDKDQRHRVVSDVYNLVDENIRTSEAYSKLIAKEAETEWPWPIINYESHLNSHGAMSNENFKERSALAAFGYTVGKTRGWATSKRHKFLNDFMRKQLPSGIEDEFGNEYGSPLSTTRLRKVANHIASICGLAIARDEHQMRFAIDDWETDLEFLKTTFYEGEGLKFTPWPDPRDSDR